MLKLAIAFALFGTAIILPGCSMTDPDPEQQQQQPPIQQWEGPRAMSFERVIDLNNEVVLDLDLDMDGISVAVTRPSTNRTKVWINRGSGWSVMYEPNGLGASSACIEPGGEKILVGLNGAHYMIFDSAGNILHGPTRYNVTGEGNEVDSWTTRQCR